jgi:U3 small nucleolar RNA-associated protein 22
LALGKYKCFVWNYSTKLRFIETTPTIWSSDKSATDFTKVGAVIRILPALAPDVFTPGKFAPGRNNIRPNTATDSADHPDAANTPTPMYNAAALRDMYLTAHLAHLYGHIKSCSALPDAFIMLKVWLHQRSLSQHTFIMKMITTYLLGGGAGSNKKLATGFSSYQLLRGTLDFVGS